jgi:hypothetical protein
MRLEHNDSNEFQTEREYVYHNCAQPGIRMFKPRWCYHTGDFSRSGYGKPPPDLPRSKISFTRVFYASNWLDTPFYWFPRHVGRIQVWRSKHTGFERAVQVLGLDTSSTRVILVDARDVDAVVGYLNIEYLFDAWQFQRLPTHEYVSKVPLRPLGERAFRVGTETFNQRQIDLVFVEDLAAIRRILAEAGFGFDAQGMIQPPRPGSNYHKTRQSTFFCQLFKWRKS